MNWLKISVFGLGLATLVASACSSSNNNNDTGPIIVGGLVGGMTGTGGATGTGGVIDTGGSTASGGSTTADAGNPIDSGVDVGAGDTIPSAGGTCAATKETHLAIIKAPTTGGLTVAGTTPPAYDTCK